MPLIEEILGSPESARQFAEFLSKYREWQDVLRGKIIWESPVTTSPPYRSGILGPAWNSEAEISPERLAQRARWVLEDITNDHRCSRVYENPGEILSKAPKAANRTFVELQVHLTGQPRVSLELARLVVQSLSELPCVAFELISLGKRIVLQIACENQYAEYVRQFFRKCLPEIALKEERDFLYRALRELPSGSVAQVYEFGLERDAPLPIKAIKDFEDDPLAGVIDALAKVAPNEVGVFQVIFAKADPEWGAGIFQMLNSVKPDFAQEILGEDNLRAIRNKVALPLVTAVVRVAFKAETQERSLNLMAAATKALCDGTRAANRLIPFSNKGLLTDYPTPSHEADVFNRQSRRMGGLYNIEELASLVHLPIAGPHQSKLQLLIPKTKSAPPKNLIAKTEEIAGKDFVMLGVNQHNNKESLVTLTENERTRHTYIIGVSGMGKSSMLFNLIYQDICGGEGVAVLDPHGDLIDKILEYIPKNRIDDVVLCDPSDEEYPIGFNVLSAHSEIERNLLASDLVAVFRRLSTAWGDQMNSVLANAILAFLESSQGGTLADLRCFLVDKGFRETFLETVKDEQVIYYWKKEFPFLSGKPQGPILTRLDAFLRPKLIRNMVCQKKNRLDFAEIMNGRKIFLAKLAQGAVGEENSYLLGSLLVSKFHQTALSRQETKASKRKPFYLYIDEFHNFITPSVASILSGGRKYKLGLTLAHQELRQLWNRDADVAGAVLANPATRVCFKLGEWDSQKLAEGLSFFSAKDLQELEIGRAICRLESPSQDFNLLSVPLEAFVDREEDQRPNQVRARSREQFATKKDSVADAAQTQSNFEAPVAKPEVVPPVIRKTEKVSPLDAPKVFDTQQPKSEPYEASPGRGGGQHKYLQQLIKDSGENLGYRAEIEKAVLDGAGRVDVALYRGEKTIACEISITCAPEQELGNVRKCLKAGFAGVALISPHQKTLKQVRKLASVALQSEEFERVVFLSPAEFLMWLEEQDAAVVGAEKTIRGYKVKANFKAVSAEEKERKRANIHQTILRALKRLKDHS